jgi:mRNA-degrading endonuclease toxin of MazEF toxin-antitoxin module
MNKSFDEWNESKKVIQAEKARLYSVREIWWCALGVNIGSEQDGKGEKFLRPCVIVRGFGADTCLVVPLTTSPKVHFLRFPIGLVIDKEASANLSQLRLIDTRRLVEKIGFLHQEVFKELIKRTRELL